MHKLPLLFLALTLTVPVLVGSAGILWWESLRVFMYLNSVMFLKPTSVSIGIYTDAFFAVVQFSIAVSPMSAAVLNVKNNTKLEFMLQVVSSSS